MGGGGGGGGGACTPPLAMRLLAMRLLCLYGIVQKTETFGYLLPSSRALRTQWQIFIPRISATILNGCLTLWCSNSLLSSLLFQRLISLQADWTGNLPHLCPRNRNLGRAFSLCWTALKSCFPSL